MVVPFVGAEIGVEAQRHQAGKSNAGTDAAPAMIAPRPGFSCDISISFGVNGPAGQNAASASPHWKKKPRSLSLRFADAEARVAHLGFTRPLREFYLAHEFGNKPRIIMFSSFTFWSKGFSSVRSGWIV